MRELKPKLIFADSGRRRRGTGGGSLLMLLIVFAGGVYVGTKLDDFGLWQGDSPTVAVTETVQTAPPDAADMGDPSPRLARSMGISAEGEGSGPYETIVVEGGRAASGDSLTPGAEPPSGEAADDSGEVGLTSINPESVSPGIADSTEVTVLSPDTATPQDAAPEDRKPAGKESYTLQVAAFAKPEDARKAVSDYRGKGYNAYTVEIENSRGEKWTLVKIGKYGSIEQAWSQAAVFKKREGKDIYVEALNQKTAVNESWEKSPDSGNETDAKNAN